MSDKSIISIKNEIKNAIVENTTAEVYIIKNKETGDYVCAQCGNKLFSSKTKFNNAFFSKSYQ